MISEREIVAGAVDVAGELGPPGEEHWENIAVSLSRPSNACRCVIAAHCCSDCLHREHRVAHSAERCCEITKSLRYLESCDFVQKCIEFSCGWELSGEKQRAHGFERLVFCKVSNVIAAIAELAGVTVEPGDGRYTRCGARETRVQHACRGVFDKVIERCEGRCRERSVRERDIE